jgi:selenide, water dikinase
MKSSTQNQPIEKSAVLVGAGNAHLQFVKRWGMRPLPGVAVTLVNETSVIPYSAMVPAHVMGEYTWDEITIDLVRLCQAVQVRFVAEKVTALDPGKRTVCFAARPPLAYDVLSLGLGSVPVCPSNSANSELCLVLRPLGTLLRKLDELENRLRRLPQPFHLAVVGGGASGCELALAIHQRLDQHAGFRLTLLQSNARLLPELPARAAHAFQEAFQRRGIPVRLNAMVVGGDDSGLLLDGGERLAVDAILWATNASPPALLRESGLALDEHGFLLARDTLQSLSDPAVFGTGDCVSFPSHPDLPKNGVHAVREGVVLFDNLAAFLREQPLRRFRPQRFCLSLLNTADGQAILTYGPLAWKSRWARRLKNHIDRIWMDKSTKFTPLTEPVAEASAMRCGGCGSKISSDVLSAVLKRLDIAADPRVLLGCQAGEDAAVYRTRPDLFGGDPDKLVEVQTVDYFKAFLDDPFLFGRIAALNAVSDLYAMNARPFSALAVATLPYARGPIQEAQLYELLSGAVQSFRELGVVLAGGHTTEGSELALGFSVTGHAEADRLFQKGRLQPGEVLVLTKPLGSGALLAAWMRGECKAVWFEKLLRSMLLPNKSAAEIFDQAGVTACTDVTGFGLAGHLLEMLDASRVSARLDRKAVPLHEGFAEVVSKGIVSSLHADNAKASCRIHGPLRLAEWLFDPQTSGGLLAAVKPERAGAVLQRLREASCNAAAIGEIIPAGGNDSPFLDLP